MKTSSTPADPIYLDHNASTPVDPRVFEAMRPFLTSIHGNPSAIHGRGRIMADAVVTARQRVADLLGASPAEIIFTSGGTESNNLAIKGVARAGGRTTGHVVTSAVEHPAVLNPCRNLAERGFDLTVVPVDGHGQVDPDAVRAAIRPDTVLVTIMHANNEVGTIQPIRQIAEIAHVAGVLFHTDAAQSCGKIPTRVFDLGVDLLTIAGHKMYAPHGIGALFIRDGVRIEPLLHGAGHERGLRPGTEPVANIVALGTAAWLAGESREPTGGLEPTPLGGSAHQPLSSFAHTVQRRDRLWEGLKETLGEAVHLHGHPHERLPNTLNVGFRGIDGRSLLARVPGLMASPGAACHAREAVPSTVLAAMNVPPEFAGGAIRFSLGRATTDEDVESALAMILAAVREMLPGFHAGRSGGA